MQLRASNRWTLVALATVYVIWSSTYLAMRWMVEALPPLLAAGARFTLAGGALYIGVRALGHRAPTKREWLASLPTGAALFVVGNGFVAIAEREVSSGLASVVCGTMPLVLASLHALWGERPTGRDLGGMALGLAGVVVIAYSELRGASGNARLLLFAPLGWALGSLLARKLRQAPGMTGAATQMLSGGVLAFVAGAATGEHLPAGPVAPRAILAFAFLVVFGSLVAYSAYHYLLSHARPALATSYAYVNPLLAVLLGVLLGGERFRSELIVGGGLVVSGVFVVARGSSRPRPRSELAVESTPLVRGGPDPV
ncbi:MAG: EamA family transporter [Polyangiaceae bacterium]